MQVLFLAIDVAPIPKEVPPEPPFVVPPMQVEVGLPALTKPDGYVSENPAEERVLLPVLIKLTDSVAVALAGTVEGDTPIEIPETVVKVTAAVEGTVMLSVVSVAV